MFYFRGFYLTVDFFPTTKFLSHLLQYLCQHFHEHSSGLQIIMVTKTYNRKNKNVPFSFLYSSFKISTGISKRDQVECWWSNST